MNQSFFLSALRSGVIVGILDAVAASVNAYLRSGVTPVGVFRYVASGALGNSAFEGGLGIASLGLLFHFIIAISWTFLFFALYEKLKFLQGNKFYVGIGYGILVWLGMNFVVLPLSSVPKLTYRIVPTIIMICIHMFVIGLSVSYLANQYFSKKT
jgi:hypothetical protein